MMSSQPSDLAEGALDASQPTAEPFSDALGPSDTEVTADAASAGIDTSRVQVLYTDTLPDGVFVVYRGGPPRLLINEGWWRGAWPVERIQALESLWARLQSLPPEAWGPAADAP